jgi:hypothetical protein
LCDGDESVKADESVKEDDELGQQSIFDILDVSPQSMEKFIKLFGVPLGTNVKDVNIMSAIDALNEIMLQSKLKEGKVNE